eukprot:SAG31_NODE_845_length_11547_cov_8.098096_9_plen_451_part_00
MLSIAQLESDIFPSSEGMVSFKAFVSSAVIGYVGCFKVPRFAINTLVPFVVADLGLDSKLTPSLLAAFHPGYIVSQLPGASIARHSGPKFVGTLQLLGCVIFMALMPRAGVLRAAGSGRAVAVLSSLFFGLGVCQGPMSPVLSQLNQAWMPKGVERAIAFRVTGLAHTAAPLFAALLTTRLGSRLGWRAVCYFYAGATACFVAAWVAFTADKPPEPIGLPLSTKPLAETEGQIPKAKTKTERPPWDWRLLTMKPSLALLGFHLSFNFMDATRHQLSPMMYMQKFGCSPVQMGTYLAIGNACHVPANFLWAAVDSWMISKKFAALTIRRAATCSACLLEAALAICYGLSPNPIVATICHGALDAVMGLHGSGGWVNYMEVGGEDTAMLNATWNSLACCSQVVVPYLGFWLRSVSGSWLPQLVLASMLKLLAGGIFSRWSAVTPVRELLVQR